eukprot:c3719_g1_i1 orf=299-940(-)
MKTSEMILDDRPQKNYGCEPQNQHKTSVLNVRNEMHNEESELRIKMTPDMSLTTHKDLLSLWEALSSEDDHKNDTYSSPDQEKLLSEMILSLEKEIEEISDCTCRTLPSTKQFCSLCETCSESWFNRSPASSSSGCCNDLNDLSLLPNCSSPTDSIGCMEGYCFHGINDTENASWESDKPNYDGEDVSALTFASYYIDALVGGSGKDATCNGR